jgi:hypothetical protein
MLGLPYAHIVVAVDGDKIIGSGYARIQSANLSCSIINTLILDSCMLNLITAARE